MSFPAHGAQITVTGESIQLTRSLLATSLGAPVQETIALSDVSRVTVTPPTSTSCGSVHLAGVKMDLDFAPNQDAAACASAIEAALRGESLGTTPAEITGLNFTAVDVETANDNWGSICQIGAVRFRDGREAEAKTWLCTPPPGLEEFAEVNVSIHGITAADVEGAPAFAAAAAELFEFLGDDVMVAHNSQFDATALRAGLLAAGEQVPKVRCACSLALSRDASKAGLISVANHKLPTVADYFSAGDFQHHDATADARAAGQIVAGLAERFGHRGDIESLLAAREFSLGEITAEAVLPVLRAHTAPISAADLGAGTDFRSDNTRLSGSGAKKAGRGSAGKPKEAKPAPWQSVATPDTIPEPNLDADPEGALFSQNVTLTGDFEPFDKGVLWSGIAERGGTVGKNVTKKTTILVIGQWGSKTSKEKRAEELIAKGQDIALWSAEQLFSEINLSDAPPF